MTIQELEAKRDELQAKKDQITGSGFIDPQQLQAVTDQLNAVLNQLAEAQYEAQQQAEHVQVVEAAKEEISSAFDAITYQGESFPIEFFAQNEVAAIAIKSFVAEKYANQADAFQRQIAEIKAEREAAKRDAQDQRELNQKLKEELAQTVLEKNDLSDKRDAAVLRAEESEKRAEEAERRAEAAELLANEKQAHIDKLREEIATGAVAAAKTVTADPEAFKRKMEEWKNSRPVIYDVQTTDPLGIRHITFKAKLVETDEEITDNYAYIGKYRVLEGDELSRFRDELADKRASEQQPVGNDQEPVQNDTPSEAVVTEETIPVPTFPEVSNENTGREMDGNPADAEGERKATLEDRVAVLEKVVFGQVNDALAALAERTGGPIKVA